MKNAASKRSSSSSSSSSDDESDNVMSQYAVGSSLPPLLPVSSAMFGNGSSYEDYEQVPGLLQVNPEYRRTNATIGDSINAATVLGSNEIKQCQQFGDLEKIADNLKCGASFSYTKNNYHSDLTSSMVYILPHENIFNTSNLLQAKLESSKKMIQDSLIHSIGDGVHILDELGHSNGILDMSNLSYDQNKQLLNIKVQTKIFDKSQYNVQNAVIIPKETGTDLFLFVA